MVSTSQWAATSPTSGLQNDPNNPPTDGQALVWSAADRRWIPGTVSSGTGGSGSPTGPAAGDLSGFYPNPSLAQIGAAATAGSGTQIPVLSIDAKGRVIALGTASVTPTGGPPSGPAGGGLGGTYPNPSVTPAAGLDTTAIHSGDAAGGDLGVTYPNPYVANLQGPSGNGYGIATEKPIGYATGGNIQIRFDLGCYDHIALSVNASFSPAGSAGMKSGSRQLLDLTNSTGGALTLTWNGSWQVANGALPTSLAPGAWLRVELHSTGTTEGSIVASYFSTTGGGVTSLATSGPGIKVNASTGAVTLTATPANRYFVEDYVSAQAAFTAACNANGIMVCPPGSTSIGTLTWPTNFAGTVQIKGCGIGVTSLSGSIQLVSNGSPVVSLEDFSVTGGIAIDLNGSNYAAGADCGNIDNVSATGLISYDSSTHGFYLKNCGQISIDGISGVGTSNTGGNGLTILGSSNVQASNVSLYHYGKGLNIGLGPCGHQYTNFRAVDCEYGIYAILDVNQGFFMSNWMVDNGNAPSTFSTPAVYLQGPGSGINACTFTSGEILLQNGGSPAYAMQLYNMEHVLINTLDFTFANPSDSCIYCSNSTSYCSVSQCAPGAGYLVHCASGTTGTRALGNVVGATFLDGGTNTLTS